MFPRWPWYTTDSGMYKGPSAHHPTIIGLFYHYFRGLSSPGFFIFIAPPSGETAGLPICTAGALQVAPAPRWRIGERASLVADGNDYVRRGGALLRPCPGGALVKRRRRWPRGCPVLRRGRRPRRPDKGQQSLNGCVGCGWKRFSP